MKYKLLIITIIFFCLSCKKYKPDFKKPVVFVALGKIHYSRTGKNIPSIVLKDGYGKLHNIPIRKGYYPRFADSIYNNCNIGDTLK